MKTPCKISVIMPVYNTEKYVGQSIESILSQTFWDFEFIIIDDCSSDKSYQICKKYAEQDSRIRLYKNERNVWVVKTRNKLLKKVWNDISYIAMIDADDIAVQNRLEEQYNYLEVHKNISLIWSDISIINEEGVVIWERKYLHTFWEVSKIIFKKSPVAQPGVMVRKSDWDKVGLYNENFERCQDYELWCRFYDAGFEIENLPQKLLQYRVFPDQWKSKHLKLSIKNTIKVQKKYIFQKKYFSLWNVFYFFAENILLLFPKSFILWLFKKLEYKNDK